METKKPTKPQRGEVSGGDGSQISGTEQAGTEQAGSDHPADAIELLRADHQAIANELATFEAADRTRENHRSARIGHIMDLASRHFAVEEAILIKSLARSGVDEVTLRVFVIWHDIARILLADLNGSRQSAAAVTAKQTVLKQIITDLIAREEAPDTGIFAWATTAGIDLTDLAAKIQSARRGLTEQAEFQQSNEPALSTLRLDVFIRTSRQPSEEFSMDRNYDNNDRDRDEDGRFTSSRNSRSEQSSRDRENYRGNDDRGRGRDNDGRGWYGDSEGHAEAAHRGWETRGRDYDDDRRGSSRASFGDRDNRDRSQSYASNDRQRDDNGRFVSEDDRSGSRGSRSSHDEDRRYSRSNDDDNRRYSRNHDEDDRYSRSNDRHRDENGRFTSEDDRSPRGRGSSDGDSHGGWFGDSRGHSDASRRGWETRRG